MIRYLCAFLWCAVAAPALAAPWAIDYPASALTFTATQSGKAVEGGFSQFTATVELDPKAPEKGSIKAVVEMKSVKTTTSESTQALPQAAWFDAAKFPQATFESTHISKKEDGSFEASGTLTIKGISQTVALPFTLTSEGDKTRAKGTVTLQRNQFGVGTGEWASNQWIAFPVEVKVSLLATPKL
jgi:polyisoprenoid-binding protein YceI